MTAQAPPVPHPDASAGDDAEAQAVARARRAQPSWQQQRLSARLRRVRALRRAVAERAETLIEQIERCDVARAPGQTLTAELWPFVDACRFLERRAPRVLRPRRLGWRGRPIWLTGLRGAVAREPLGVVLIIGPSNYPWMLPGIQAMQALAAGNAVLLKPGRAAAPAARAFAGLSAQVGVPRDLVHVLDEAPLAAQNAIRAGVDQIVLTGSAEAGHAVMHAAADSLTPTVAELSGCDALVVLDGAEPARVIEAVQFGMRFNGSATCIAPRRLIAAPALRHELTQPLREAFHALPAVQLSSSLADQLRRLLADAQAQGATITAGGIDEHDVARPLLVERVSPEMALARADLFAPVLCVMAIDDVSAARAREHAMPYRLGASIFGEPRQARELARTWPAGCVTVNDLIVPTADPRVPFGADSGSRSGFGVTRGPEGLLAMTRPRPMLERRGRHRPHFQPMNAATADALREMLRLAHGPAGGRLATMRRLLQHARRAWRHRRRDTKEGTR